MSNKGKVFQELQKRKFRKNDLVSTGRHNRLMVVDVYRQNGKIVMTEGGYYDEDSLILIFRRQRGKDENSNRLRGMDQR